MHHGEPAIEQNETACLQLLPGKRVRDPAGIERQSMLQDDGMFEMIEQAAEDLQFRLVGVAAAAWPVQGQGERQIGARAGLAADVVAHALRGLEPGVERIAVDVGFRGVQVIIEDPVRVRHEDLGAARIDRQIVAQVGVGIGGIETVPAFGERDPGVAIEGVEGSAVEAGRCENTVESGVPSAMSGRSRVKALDGGLFVVTPHGGCALSLPERLLAPELAPDMVDCGARLHRMGGHKSLHGTAGKGAIAAGAELREQGLGHRRVVARAESFLQVLEAFQEAANRFLGEKRGEEFGGIAQPLGLLADVMQRIGMQRREAVPRSGHMAEPAVEHACGIRPGGIGQSLCVVWRTGPGTGARQQRQRDRQLAERDGAEDPGQDGISLAAAAFGRRQQRLDPAISCKGATDGGAGTLDEDIPVARRPQGVRKVAQLTTDAVQRGAGGTAEHRYRGAQASHGDTHLVHGLGRVSGGSKAAPVQDDIGEMRGDCLERQIHGHAGLDARGAASAGTRRRARRDRNRFGSKASPWNGEGKGRGEVDGQCRHVRRGSGEENTARGPVTRDAAQCPIEKGQGCGSCQRSDPLAAGERCDRNQRTGRRLGQQPGIGRFLQQRCFGCRMPVMARMRPELLETPHTLLFAERDAQVEQLSRRRIVPNHSNAVGAYAAFAAGGYGGGAE